MGFSNAGSLIAMAAAGTGAAFLSLFAISATLKRDVTGTDRFLFAGIAVVLLAMLADIFFQVPALALAISAAAIPLFSPYLLYDINRIVQGSETDYIVATLRVYLDLYTIFVNLLMAFSGDQD